MDLDELAMMLDCINVETTSHEDFQRAVVMGTRCPFDQDHKLILYGLYKQGTVGKVPHQPPPEGDSMSSSKWYLL